MNVFEDNGHIRSLADIEREVIETALNRYHGNICEVSRHLKIGRSTLYRRLIKYNLFDKRVFV